MNFKSIILTFVSIVIILIFTNMGFYKAWFQQKIFSFPEDMVKYEEYQTLEQRRRYRLGGPYIGMKAIKEYFVKHNVKDAVVLLPPDDYYKKYDANLVMPEPVICYLYGGLRTTRITCNDVNDANYCVLHNGTEFILQELANKDDLQKVIEHYKAK